MSGESLFSAHWHHVRDVSVRLADDVKITRHVYRDRVSWVLYRHATSTSHRLDTLSFELIDKLDGTTTVGEVWEQALEQRDQCAPTQDVWMQLLADLHAADLLVVNSRIPVETLFERRKEKRARDHRQRYLNPLYMRFSLIDPDGWLDRLRPVAAVIFSRGAFALWVTLIVLSGLVLFTNSERFFADVAMAAQLDPYRVALFLVTYPILKFAHELGHALAIKRCGGHVRELGIALLVMLPMPYVDASASSVFKSKHDRMMVSAAGIQVELGLAALGCLLWISSNGLMHDLGLVLVLTGGLSTLLINGNPLLKFDGYYLLADWLEIPNLQSRSRRAVGRLLRRLFSGKQDGQIRAEDLGERRWLLSYGVGSAVYRTGLMLWIAWMVSERWVLLGMAISVFALTQAVLLPLYRGVRILLLDEQLQVARARALAVCVPFTCVAFVTLVPLPHASVTEGVVWLPDEAVVRVAGTCEVTEVRVDTGRQVQAGDVLFACTNAELVAEQRYFKARVSELEATVLSLARTDKVEYAVRKPELDAAKDQLADIQQRIEAEQHRASVDGQFDISGTASLLGRAFLRGDIAAYTIPATGRTIRLAFAERQFADIDNHVERIEIRLRRQGLTDRVYTTSMRSRSPRASIEVPTAGLSSAGGGPHTADPAGDGRLLLDSVVDIELNWPIDVEAAAIGEHVAVRFVHSPKPLAGRFVTTIKRAFMDRRPV